MFGHCLFVWLCGCGCVIRVCVQVRRWERTLNHVSETMDVWFTVQTRWQYLEGIFSSDDIRQQLPEEARKFAAIDKTWKGVMAATLKTPNVR
jgi:dynein heavy chain